LIASLCARIVGKRTWPQLNLCGEGEWIDSISIEQFWLILAEGTYQGTSSLVPDPNLFGSYTVANVGPSALPQASAQLPKLERSALKDPNTTIEAAASE